MIGSRLLRPALVVVAAPGMRPEIRLAQPGSVAPVNDLSKYI